MNAPIDRYSRSYTDEDQPEISQMGYVVIFAFAILAVVATFLYFNQPAS